MLQLPIVIHKMIYDYIYYYDPKKHTPAHMGITGNINGIKWILAHRKWNNDQKKEALKYATQNGHAQVFQLLYYPEFNVRKEWKGHVDILKVYESPNFGDFIIGDILEYNYEESLLYLVHKGYMPTWNILSKAAEHGRLNLVKIILKYKIHVQNDIFPAIWVSCMGGQIKVFKYLMDQYAALYRDPYYTKQLLESTCIGGHVDIMSELRQRIGCTPVDYKFPLYKAIRLGRYDLVVYLLDECDIIPSVVDQRLLDYVEQCGYIRLHDYLKVKTDTFYSVSL